LPQLRKQLHMMHAKLRNTTKRCTWPPENELLLPIYTAFSRRTGPSCLQGLMMINDYYFLARLLDTILLDLGILPLFDSCLLTYSKLSKTGDCSKSPASWRQRCHSTVCWWHCTLAYHPTDVSSQPTLRQATGMTKLGKPAGISPTILIWSSASTCWAMQVLFG
jgi:hypothetical protein